MIIVLNEKNNCIDVSKLQLFLSTRRVLYTRVQQSGELRYNDDQSNEPLWSYHGVNKKNYTIIMSFKRAKQIDNTLMTFYNQQMFDRRKSTSSVN